MLSSSTSIRANGTLRLIESFTGDSQVLASDPQKSKDLQFSILNAAPKRRARFSSLVLVLLLVLETKVSMFVSSRSRRTRTSRPTRTPGTECPSLSAQDDSAAPVAGFVSRAAGVSSFSPVTCASTASASWFRPGRSLLLWWPRPSRRNGRRLSIPGFP